MRTKYVVTTLYEGKCPLCGEYQCSQLDTSVDKVCSECKRKVVKDILFDGTLTCLSINGNFIEGFRIKLQNTKTHKTVTIRVIEISEELEKEIMYV